jgi:hypothetical protein
VTSGHATTDDLPDGAHEDSNEKKNEDAVNRAWISWLLTVKLTGILGDQSKSEGRTGKTKRLD